MVAGCCCCWAMVWVGSSCCGRLLLGSCEALEEQEISGARRFPLCLLTVCTNKPLGLWARDQAPAE